MTSTPRSAPVAVAALIALITTHGSALAQASRAQTLFDSAKEAFAAGDFPAACARFRASDAIEPATGTRTNLARCEEERGHLLAAARAWQDALTTVDADDPRVEPIRAHLAGVEAKTPSLKIQLAAGADPASRVHEGNGGAATVHPYDVRVRLDPGLHDLVVRAPRRRPWRTSVVLREGDFVTIAVHPGEPEEPPPAPPPQSLRTPTWGPWALGGTGILALSAGTVLGALVVRDKAVVDDDCALGSSPGCRSLHGVQAAHDVRVLGPATTATLVAGGTLLAAGGIWLAVRRRRDGEGALHVRVSASMIHTEVTW